MGQNKAYGQLYNSQQNYYSQLYSLNMYRNQPTKVQTPFQTVDFISLRKTNHQPTCKYENGFMCFINQNNTPLLLIGANAFLQNTISPSDCQFSDFPFENTPKQFSQYCHQKTASQIFNLLKMKSKTGELMVQMLNSYPILVFILQCWIRKRTILWLESNPSNQCMGNQHQILLDCCTEIRGPLLSMVAVAFKMWVNINFQAIPVLNTVICQEQFGDFTSKWELKIEYKLQNMVIAYVVERDEELLSSFPSSKNSECGYLRRSKFNENEVDVRRGNEFKSLKKERLGQCIKCGMAKRCECNQIKRKGLGMNSKNNQLSNSTSNHLKNDPFVFGFLNEHNLSKIRQSSSGQK